VIAQAIEAQSIESSSRFSVASYCVESLLRRLILPLCSLKAAISLLLALQGVGHMCIPLRSSQVALNILSQIKPMNVGFVSDVQHLWRLPSSGEPLKSMRCSLCWYNKTMSWFARPLTSV